METSQKNNYKNEHIASKKALSATGIVTLIVVSHSAKMREIVWKRFSKKKISNKSVR